MSGSDPRARTKYCATGKMCDFVRQKHFATAVSALYFVVRIEKSDPGADI